MHLIEKGAAVASGPASLRGDKALLCRSMTFDLLNAAPQRLNRPAHRDLRKNAGAGKALAEADDLGIRINHAQLSCGRAFGDQQAAVVGAEVDRRVKLRRLARSDRKS